MAENGTNGEEETQEAAEEEKPVEEEATAGDKPEEQKITSTGTQPDEDTGEAKDECKSEEECSWDAYQKERFETAVFTLATFAAVFAVYIYIVYSLSSPPTVLHRM